MVDGRWSMNDRLVSDEAGDVLDAILSLDFPGVDARALQALTIRGGGVVRAIVGATLPTSTSIRKAPDSGKTPQQYPIVACGWPP